MDKGKDSRGTYRAIYTNIWDDPDFRSLPSEAKLVFLNLRTSPLSNMPAIFHFYIEAIQKQTGLRRNVIEEALNILSRNRWIIIQEGVVWVRNGLKFDPNISLKNEKQVKAINKILSSLPKLELVLDFCGYYGLGIPYEIANREGTASPIPIQEPEPEPEKEPETEPESTREQARPPSPNKIFDLWNATVKHLPKIVSLSDSRREKIRMRLKEHPDLGFWQDVFCKADEVLIPASKTHPREWKPDFDWIMENDRNYLKVLEGKYPGRKRDPFSPQPGLDQWLERKRREESGDV